MAVPPAWRRRTLRLLNRVSLLLGYDLVLAKRVQARSDLIRLGTDYGGWVIPAELLPQAQSAARERAGKAVGVAYCAGCGEDISFDLALLERFELQVVGLDPTPRAIAYVGSHPDAEGYAFYPWGLWEKEAELAFYVPQNPAHVSHSLVNLQGTSESIRVPVKSVAQTMRELGHTDLLLLKLDIEGAEYSVLTQMLKDGVLPRILCVEFDEFAHPQDGAYLERIRGSVAGLLAAGYRLIHSEGNANYTFLHTPL